MSFPDHCGFPAWVLLLPTKAPFPLKPSTHGSLETCTMKTWCVIIIRRWTKDLLFNMEIYAVPCVFCDTEFYHFPSLFIYLLLFFFLFQVWVCLIHFHCPSIEDRFTDTNVAQVKRRRVPRHVHLPPCPSCRRCRKNNTPLLPPRHFPILRPSQQLCPITGLQKEATRACLCLCGH